MVFVSRRIRFAQCFVVGFLFLFLTVPSFGYTVKERINDLDDLVFSKTELRVTHVISKLDDIRSNVTNVQAYDRLLADLGPSWFLTVDERSGKLNLLEGGAIPWIPGVRNDLNWRDLGFPCSDNSCIPVEVVEAKARQFIKRYQDALGLEDFGLVVSEGSGPYGNSLYMFRFHLTYRGIPIQECHVDFRINSGNLIQVGFINVGHINLDPNPSLTVSSAWEILTDYLGSGLEKGDQIVDKGTLQIIPITPWGQDPNVFNGPVGSGLSYALVYRLMFERPGVIGLWEAIIDAHTGEILRFVDANRYGSIHGYIYPIDNHTGEVDMPFPFADTGLTAPDDYADEGGNFPGNNATVTLVGKYTWISDGCGTISNTTTTGEVDFMGSTAETDCDVPVGNTGGAGNTWSARTLFWNATMINIKGRTYYPTNTWLNTDHINVNTNGSPWCNATSGGGTINFYQSDTNCWNLGEIPSVCLHEWGHSWDNYDGSGDQSPPLETRADFHATFQNHDSCCGRGFYLTGNCSGYGDACLNCSGIRDHDYTQHTNNTPWTAANHGTFWSCSGGSYFGPCGLEDHCESGISSQALWEFVNNDLVGPPTNMDVTSAWELADRLFWLSHSQLGDMYTCTPPTSDGCNADGLWVLFRAIDDDGDGTANGTPHAAAIFSALDRHNIACLTSSDPENQNQTSCPPLVIGTLSGSAGSNAVSLSWDAVTNATRYKIFKNQIDCGAGFTEIAEIAAPTTNYTDSNCVNGIQYNYRYQALTASDSCTSALSNCVSVTPQPCAGAVTLDRATYNCSDTITISVLDSDLTGNGTQDVTVWSDSEMTPETITLTETPPNSAMFVGTIDTTSSTASGDGMIGVVHGDTITVRYVDLDYCGIPNVNVDSSATADCVGPVIFNVQVINITNDSAMVTWETDETANSRVTYDSTVPPGSIEENLTVYSTTHSLLLQGLIECTTYYFSVTSADPAGNSSTDDNSGAYYTFKTWMLQVAFFDDMESGIGSWTIDGLWHQVTEPTCTPSASSPTTSWYYGQDSTCNFDTGATNTGRLYSSAITDITAGAELHFWYRRDTECGGCCTYDNTYVQVSTDGGSNWTTLEEVCDDTGTWVEYAGWDLSAYAGQTINIGFYFDSYDSVGNTYLGWMVDDVMISSPAPCPDSAGTIELDDVVYGCNSDTIEITVMDADLSGTANADISSTAGDLETVVCSETIPSVFVGTINTSSAAVNIGDGVLQVANADTVTATYYDADDGTGNPATVQDTATIDCQGPVITNVQTINISDNSATITWDTDINANSQVTYDPFIPPVTTTDDLSNFVTNHSMDLTLLNSCTTYYYSVTSEDIYANPTTDDNGGMYYSFTTYFYLAFLDENMETDPGWTHSGTYDDWERGVPTVGPSGAHSGTSCYATNLSGNYTKSGGTTNGEYYLYTTPIDLSAATPPITFSFWHWYDIYTDNATNGTDDGSWLELSTDGGSSWSVITPNEGYTNTLDDEAPYPSGPCYAGTTADWEEATFDLSSYAGQVIELRFAFFEDNDTGTAAPGWYIDDVRIGYAAACSPNAAYGGHTFSDSCATGGPGDADGILDAGESAVLPITISNTGYGDLTGVWAELSSTTSGITILDSQANYPDIPQGANASSIAPHFQIYLAETVACGTTIDFDLDIHSNEGDFTGTFTETVGQIIPGAGTILDEAFEGTFPPTGWSVINNGASGDGVWDRNDTLGQTNHTSGSGYCAATGLDGDSGTAWDTELWSPSLDLSTYTTSELTYASNFQDYAGNGDIYLDVSIDGGSNWTNLRTQSVDDPTGGTSEVEDLTAYVGETIILRWYYVASTSTSWYWNIDDVQVTYTEPATCLMNTCLGGCGMSVDVTPDGTTQVCEGDNIMFTATPTSGIPPFSYQWTEDGSDISGATTSTHTASYTSAQSHTYNCKITDSSGVCIDIQDPSSSTGEWIVCAGTPPPVADGMTGAGIQLSKVSGDTINVSYDNTTCSSDHAVVLYGSLADFTTYTGAVSNCNVGSSGNADFDITADNVWFNLVWVNASGTGGHPGFTTSGDRPLNANGFCGVVADDHSDNVCD